MLRLALLAALLAGVPAATAASGAVIAAHGVRLTVPDGWRQVPATPSSISDPRTLLVVATTGVGRSPDRPRGRA